MDEMLTLVRGEDNNNYSTHGPGTKALGPFIIKGQGRPIKANEDTIFARLLNDLISIYVYAELKDMERPKKFYTNLNKYSKEYMLLRSFMGYTNNNYPEVLFVKPASEVTGNVIPNNYTYEDLAKILKTKMDRISQLDNTHSHPVSTAKDYDKRNNSKFIKWLNLSFADNKLNEYRITKETLVAVAEYVQNVVKGKMNETQTEAE